MKRVFLDANVLWSAAHKPDSLPWRMIVSDRARFLTSHYAVADARRNTAPENQPTLEKLVKGLELVRDAFGPPPPGVILPDKDIPILAAVALARADLLVTGDQQHFAAYFGRQVGAVKVILPRDLDGEL